MADRACVALIDGDQILMVRQGYRGEMLWTSPGGTIEAGETPQAAAIRETHEETGFEVQIIKLAYQGPRRSGSGTYYCFLGKIIGGRLLLGHDVNADGECELHELCWFRLVDMHNHPEVARCLNQI